MHKPDKDDHRTKPTDLEIKMLLAIIVALILLQVMMWDLDQTRAALDTCRGLK